MSLSTSAMPSSSMSPDAPGCQKPTGTGTQGVGPPVRADWMRQVPNTPWKKMLSVVAAKLGAPPIETLRQRPWPMRAAGAVPWLHMQVARSTTKRVIAARQSNRRTSAAAPRPRGKARKWLPAAPRASPGA